MLGLKESAQGFSVATDDRLYRRELGYHAKFLIMPSQILLVNVDGMFDVLFDAAWCLLFVGMPFSYLGAWIRLAHMQRVWIARFKVSTLAVPIST